MNFRLKSFLAWLMLFLALIGVGISIGWHIKPATMTITKTPLYYSFTSDGIPTTQDIQDPGGPDSLEIIGVHYYPQLVYLYGIPYWQFQMPKTPYYTLAPELMPWTEANIEAGYAVENTNTDGTVTVEIPVSPNTTNVSRVFDK